MLWMQCNNKKEKQNKTWTNKKHKNFSNFVLNKYVKKDVYIDKFKDVIISYYKEPIKNW